jgi:hypothetical protein
MRAPAVKSQTQNDALGGVVLESVCVRRHVLNTCFIRVNFFLTNLFNLSLGNILETILEANKFQTCRETFEAARQ